MLGLLGLVFAGTGGALAWLMFGMSDTERGKLATQILNAYLPGNFAIAEVSLSFPIALDIHGVAIEDPDGKPVARARHIAAQFNPLPLVRREVEVFDITVNEPWVSVVLPPGKNQVVGIQTAFLEVMPEPPKPGEPVWRVVLLGITVHQAELVVQTPDAKVQARKLEITDASLWTQGEDLGLTLELGGAATLHSEALDIALRQLHISAQDLRYHFAKNDGRVAVERIAATTPGFSVELGGTLQATDTELKEFSMRGTAQIDTAFAQLRTRLPPGLVKDLSGGVKVRFKVDGSGTRQRFDVGVTGSKLAWRHVEIDRVAAAGLLKGSELALNSSSLRLDGVDIDTVGTLSLFPSRRIAAGKHDLKLSTRDFPLRRLLGPLVDQPQLIPERVSLALHTQGRALWPMTSEVDIDMSANGVPASSIPGVPDPFVAHGKLLTHPDAVEIFQMRLGSDTAQVAVQGIVPFKPQGVVEILRNLHIVPVRITRLAPESRAHD